MIKLPQPNNQANRRICTKIDEAQGLPVTLVQLGDNGREPIPWKMDTTQRQRYSRRTAWYSICTAFG
jgi:hypothetical protein